MLVLGEDVVELVAPAAQAPDVGPLAVAILDLRLGRRVVVVVVILLGEAEVDERAVPGVAESHRCRCVFARRAGFLPMLVIRGRRGGPLMVQLRADPHDCRALLDGDEVVLRGAHRQVLQAALAASSRSAANQRRLRSGSCESGGIVISPPTGTAERAMNASSSFGATPALPASPATLTSTRMAPWPELAMQASSIALGGDARLAGLAGDVHLDQISSPGRA